MSSSKHMISAAIAAALCLSPLTASADQTRELIHALVENGHLTQEQAEEILAAEQRPAITPAWTNFKDFRIRGRIQAQVGYVHADSDEGSEDYSTLELRRARLGVQGTLLQDVRAQLEANFVPGDGFSMRSAFLQWRKYEEAYIKAGFDRPAFGFERTTSSASIYTVERSHLTNTIISDDMLGLSVEGKKSVFNYGAGIYNNDANANPNGSPRYLYNGSIGVKLDSYLPEKQTLGLRADVIVNDDRAGDFTFDEGFSLSAHWGLEPFDLRLEYLHANSFDNDATYGWYILPSYFVTEKFQLVGRYENMRSDNDTGIRSPSRYMRRAENFDIRGDKFQAVYLGGNYYLKGDAHKFMTGVEYAELDTGSAPTGEADAITVYGAWRILF